MSQSNAVVQYATASLFTMYVRKLPDIIFRDFPDYGYLTDNRNWGYDTACKSRHKVGDLLVSKTGSVFYSYLDYVFQDVEDIVGKAVLFFHGAKKEEITKDAKEFYKSLSEQGYIQCSEYQNDAELYPYTFSYDNHIPSILTEEYSDVIIPFDNYGEVPWLTRVHIDVSGLCNENCVHCYIPAKNKKGVMPPDLFFSILNQCKDLNVLNLTISGGEPLNNPHILSFLSKCRELNFSVNLLTNLTKLREEHVISFKENPLLSVQTSLYSMNPAVHDSITGYKGSFVKTIRAIKLLHEKDVPMQINCPIIKQNLQDYKGVLDWASEYNIETSSDFNLFGCYDTSMSNLDCRLNIEEMVSVLNAMCGDENFRSELEASAKSKKMERDDNICPVCQNSICISNKGDVYPCEGWQQYVLGNVNYKTIKEIWEQSQDINELRNLKVGDFPKCAECSDRKYCSTCLIMNANENKEGDFRKVNPFLCAVAKIKKDMLEN